MRATEVIKMAGVCGQVDTSLLIGQKKGRVLVEKETGRSMVVRSRQRKRVNHAERPARGQ